MIRLGIVFCIIFAPSLLLAADADPITITQTVDGDVIPPTTPVSVTATVVSANQIDVSWGASTDSTGIGGYVVYRDGGAIATTTLLTFADTGLVASTTYTYFITAFDNSGLYSSSSATSSATTPAAPVVAAQPVVSESAQLLFPTLRDITVSTTAQSARLMWTTNIAARYALRWGRTDSYEMGGVQNELYRRNQETLLTSLQPGTTYYYELIGINRRGDERVLQRGVFTTTVLPDQTAPPNVALLTGTAAGEAVQLSWKLPTVTDLEKIRIVRNHLYIPTDPTNGFVVYEGLGETYTDSTAFITHARQYYTVYSYDTSGNQSSGAVVVVSSPMTAPSAPRQPVPDSPSGAPATATEPADSTTPPDRPALFPDEVVATPDMTRLTFGDFWWWQADVFVPVRQGRVTVSADSPFTVGIGSEAVSERFRSLVVRFENAQQSNAFLLGANADGDAYEATVATLVPGVYDTTFTMTALTGRAVVVATGTLEVYTDDGFVINQPFDVSQTIRLAALAGGLFLFALWLLWWWRRGRA